MNVVSIEFCGLREGEPPYVEIRLDTGEVVTVPLDGKPENEAVLARIFGEDAAEPAQA